MRKELATEGTESTEKNIKSYMQFFYIFSENSVISVAKIND